MSDSLSVISSLVLLDTMQVFATTIVLYVVVPLFTFTNGASIGQKYLKPNEIAALNSMWDGVNFTELEMALKEDHPHKNLSVTEIIELYDYNVETHHIETNDGYILNAHRITGNSQNTSPEGKPVVILQHGLLSSSSAWVITGPKNGLGFILADAGYDVWLGNVRGNPYAREHKNLTTDDPKYWTFSWHELGTLDLTATIDYILKETGREKLFYIGHSQGTTMFFTMATERPEYNDKIQAAFALAPVTYSSRMFHPIYRALSRMVDQIHLVFKLIGIYEFNPNAEFFKMFTSKSCKEGKINQKICMNIMFLMFGFNKDQMDSKLVPVIVAQDSASAGVNQLVHYGQIIKSGHFRQIDLGLHGNLVKYNRFTPPDYKLENVRAPVALHYGMSDWLVNPKDVDDLYSELPNPIGKFRIPLDSFNHMDFIGAKDVKTLLYDKILTLMSRYKN